MKIKIYTVYDVKMEAYMTPFFMQSKGQAIRAWQDAVSDPQTQFYKHPGDFTLFEVAEYDDATALITSYETKVNLGTALEHKKERSTLPMEGNV